MKPLFWRKRCNGKSDVIDLTDVTNETDVTDVTDVATATVELM